MIMIIGGIASAIGTGKWSGLFENYLDSVYPYLSDIVLVVAITLGGIVAFYQYMIKKESPNSDVNAHLQNLNVVYQKLDKMQLKEIDNEWVRKIPVELEKDELEYIESLHDLDRALKHLKQNKKYKNVFDAWNKLDFCIKEFNSHIPIFTNFLEEYIKKTMSEKTKYVESDYSNEGYDLQALRKSVMILIDQHLEYGLDKHLIGLKIDEDVIQFESDKFTIPVFLTNNIDPEKIKEDLSNLFLEFVHDKIVLEKYAPYDEMRSDMFVAENMFEQTIDPLIHDIKNNGLVLEGTCDLPY